MDAGIEFSLWTFASEERRLALHRASFFLDRFRRAIRTLGQLSALFSGRSFVLLAHGSFHAGQNLAAFEFGAMLFANLARNVPALSAQTCFDIALEPRACGGFRGVLPL